MNSNNIGNNAGGQVGDNNNMSLRSDLTRLHQLQLQLQQLQNRSSVNTTNSGTINNSSSLFMGGQSSSSQPTRDPLQQYLSKQLQNAASNASSTTSAAATAAASSGNRYEDSLRASLGMAATGGGTTSPSLSPIPGRLLAANNNPMLMAAAAAAGGSAAGNNAGGLLGVPQQGNAFLSQLPTPHSLFLRQVGDGINQERRMRGGVIEPFPEKLHRLLLEVEAAGRADVISFVANGRAFAIHKPDAFFKEIVPLYFRQSRLSSFKRQLNLYGFELINVGPARGGYYHELFVREQPHLCRKMRRMAIKTSAKSPATSTDIKQEDTSEERSTISQAQQAQTSTDTNASTSNASSDHGRGSTSNTGNASSGGEHESTLKFLLS